MAYVNVQVSSSEVLSEISMEELAEYLVKQDNYENYIAQALAKHKKTTFEPKDIEVDVLELINHYSMGKNIKFDLSRIADIYFGRII